MIQNTQLKLKGSVINLFTHMVSSFLLCHYNLQGAVQKLIQSAYLVTQEWIKTIAILLVCKKFGDKFSHTVRLNKTFAFKSQQIKFSRTIRLIKRDLLSLICCS